MPVYKENDLLPLSEECYGPLYKYIIDKDVTDTDFNGRDLWITYTDMSKRRIDEVKVTKDFIERFCSRVAANAAEPFNPQNPTIESDSGPYRITIIHDSAAISGATVTIRRSMEELRYTTRDLVESKYCSMETLSFLYNCVKARCNIVICGDTGIGKTELMKFLSAGISERDKIVTIEDSAEFHISNLYPEKDTTSLIVSKQMDYTAALKICKRINAKAVIVTEARSVEAKYILENWSSGMYGFVSTHGNDTTSLGGRFVTMVADSNDSDRVMDHFYQYAHIGVHLKSVLDSSGRYHRIINEVCAYERIGKGDYKNHLIVEYGKETQIKIPEFLQEKFDDINLTDPYKNEELLLKYIESEEEVISA